MPPFVSLDTLAPLGVTEVGELAWELARLHHLGYPVAPGWVIPASVFEQTLLTLVNREPLLGEWPHLLGQADLVAATSLPRLSQRLRQAIQMALLDWPWDDLLAAIPTPVVRLQPSLWWAAETATAPFGQMVGEGVCWADEHSLAKEIKHLWGRMVGGHSWAYWQRSPHPPLGLKVAVLIQPMDMAQVSGTLHLRPDGVQIQLVRGNIQGLPEAIPDRYQGGLLICDHQAWQQGYQERLYQPAGLAHITVNPETCLLSSPARETGLTRFQPALLQPLVHRLGTLITPQALAWQVEWHLPINSQQVQITQALPWPLTPNPPQLQGTTTPLRLGGMGAAPGQVSGPAWVLPPGEAPPMDLAGQVLVAPEISPSWLPQLKTAAALASEAGGLTSHGAILARELGIPAVVGCAGVTQRFTTGDWVRLDGDRGTIAPCAPHCQLPTVAPITPGDFQALGDAAPALWVNLTQPEAAAAAADLPVAGVGLLRSEWLIMPCLQGRHPYHWIAAGEGESLQAALVAQLRPILAAFAPRPVRYRSLDLRSHEMADLVGAPPVETNPMLGLRGTFSYQHHPTLFNLELAALRQLQREGYGHLQLLLPFVRTVEEFNYCRDMITAAKLSQGSGFQTWIMAEVPSVLFLLSAYQAAGVQGIAIGTNDLTQLLLGVDRDQVSLSRVFDEGHPAVQGAIAQLIQQAQALDLPTTLCGLDPRRHPQMIPNLLRWGISSLSVDLAAMAEVVAAIKATQ